MIILEDSRQQAEKHKIKHLWFEKNGIELRRTKLYVGDYTLPANQNVCVDTKKDIQELISDVCGKQHERFRDECLRAQEAGIKLYILVENKGGYVDKRNTIYCPTIKSLSDLHSWKNPRLFMWRNGKQLYPSATKGITLQKVCNTMQAKYGVEFLFCTPEESGKKIVELLERGVNAES